MQVEVKWNIFIFSFYLKNFSSLLCSTLSSSSLSSRHKSSHLRCSIKKVVLKKFAIFTKRHLCQSHFSMKWQAWRPTILLKRDSNIGVFLWILRNFKKHQFWRTSASGSYCTQFPFIYSVLIYFWFMSNTVCIMCIISIIKLSIK